MFARTALLAFVLAVLAASAAAAVNRTYFIAAEEVEWDYLPTNWDLFHGVPMHESPHAPTFCENGPDRVGKVYRKAVYREYTDGSFAVPAPRPAWLGNLGPIIRGEVGDVLLVVFLNRASFPFSMHPHGVFYDKNNEGAYYADNQTDKTGASIPPGSQYTYRWEVRERSGPGPNDASSILWSYHSHVNEVMDIYSGLIGPMIIYRPGMLGADGLPTDIDREVVMYLIVGDENQSRYLEHNINAYCGAPDNVEVSDDDFIESNLMHNINGYLYCNLNNIFMCEGEVVRWYVFAFGTEVDVHTLHWHASTLLTDGHRVDVLELLPATMRVLDMQVDNPGNWLTHCHVSDHSMAGMLAYFQVAPAGGCDAGFKPWVHHD